MDFDAERALARHDAHAMLNFRRNYMAHAFEGGFYMAGLTFVAFETILPPIVKSLGGPDWLISLSPSLCTLGFALPSLFTAHLLEPLVRKMPIIIWTGIIVRMPFLLAALCLFFLAGNWPLLTLAAVVLAPFLNGLINGATCTAWFELFAKTVPPSKRASLFAVRLVMAGAGGLIAGKIMELALAKYPGATGYGILHLACFLCMMASFFVFCKIKETPLPPLDKERPATLKGSLAELPEILREDKNFRSYLIARFFACAPYAAIPFLSIHALETLKLPQSYLGSFFMAFTLGSMAGNFFSGYAGDKFGGRVPMIISMALYMLTFALAAIASSLWLFTVVFVLVGFCRDASNVATGTLLADLPPPARRVKYFAMSIATLAPGMLLAPLLGGLAWSYGGGRYIFPATLAIALLAVALYLTFNIRDVRRPSAKEPAK